MSASGILLEIAVKTSLVFFVAWVVTHLLAKRWPAAARHLVWALAMAAALSIPILVNVGPTWEVAAVPGTWAASVRSVLGASSGGPYGDSDVWPNTPSVSSHAPMVAEQTRRERARNLATALQPSGAREATWWFTLPILVTFTWTVGACAVLVSLIVGLLWTSWFARRAAPLLTPEWTALLAATAARVGVTARVRLSVSPHVGVPVACGLFRHTILLPIDADSWDHERRTVVLLHELAHVKRHDCLVQAMARLAWALHWYNPLALLAQSELRTEQERACDDIVLNVGTPAVAYADHLCEIASHARRTLVPVWSTTSIARPSRLTGRVTAILDDTRRRRPPSRRFYAAALGLVSLGVVPLAAAHEPMAAHAMANLPIAPVARLSSYTTLLPARHSRDVSADTAHPIAVTELSARAAAPAARPTPQELTTESSRVLLRGCMTCHNSVRRTANLAFEELDVEQPAKNVDIWENVVRRLHTNLHPPAGAPRPSRATAEAFAASLEAALDRADQGNWVPGRAEPISDSELATRLATFLWSAAPDDALRASAASGGLHDPVKLEQQVRRMLADKRADAFLTGFFGNWLYLKNLSTVKVKPEQFSNFDNLREAFRQETALFLASQIRGDRALTELLSANYTFLNDRLAEHYDIAGVTGSQFRKVTLPNDVRTGLLGHGSILTITSFGERTSPVVRGKWLMETWLGLLVPPPPPNIPALKPRDPALPATMRTRMEQHRRNPACASCHTTMDSLGFALENFDPIGGWRTTEDGLAIDASGTLADGSRFDGPSQLRGLLMDRQEAIINTMVLKLLAYSLGRPARFSDMPAVRAIVWDASSHNYSWTSTIVAVVKSAPFRLKQID